MSVMIETSIGEIVIDLYADKCYKSSLNFIKLCKIKAYNFNLFTVQKNFISQVKTKQQSIWWHVQGNDRNYFQPEFKFKHNKRGLVSFVCRDFNGTLACTSDFYITLTDTTYDYLDKNAIFGQVVEGLDVLEKLNDTIVDGDGRPYRDVRIKHTIILDDPFDDPVGLVIPAASPIPSRSILADVRIGEDEELESNLLPEELAEKTMRDQMNASALTLEIVGDLPFAEIKPPENVLFVCKLNPCTRSEDLEVIFARFGPISSCQVIKDQKNGESLCFAFIEYEIEKDCERAFAKMDNVLIDERRIKVDFSQSVAKLHRFSDTTQKTSEGVEQTVRESESYGLLFDEPKSKNKGTPRESKDNVNKSKQRIRDTSSSKTMYVSRGEERGRISDQSSGRSDDQTRTTERGKHDRNNSRGGADNRGDVGRYQDRHSNKLRRRSRERGQNRSRSRSRSRPRSDHRSRK